jgi:hypothetical protein
MDEKLVTSRRQALGLASLAVAGVAVGAPAAVAATAVDPRRPSDAEMERVSRLYAGEFGGGRGVR